MKKTPTSYSRASDAFEQRLTQVLDKAPEVQIPEGFAARTAALGSRRTAPQITASRFGRSATFIAIGALLLIMIVLAPAALRASNISLAIEFVFAVEFVVLICYISLTTPSAR